MSLFFSPACPCLSTLSCWLCLRCSFPAASSIHQVQAADLRRVSAPPGSFTMWVQCHSVLTLFPQLLLLRGRSPAASFSSTGLLLEWGAHLIIDAFRPPFLCDTEQQSSLCFVCPHPLCICPFIFFWDASGPMVVWVGLTVYAEHHFFRVW